ncbi:MAG: hypothetical protein C0613_06140 [Desulfobulbaceae bacterium]|nr:MAG: hypothetical protein C0613_06140 [Desulfobulbaceae bacterium]
MIFDELAPSRANRLINHGPVVLISCRDGDRTNIMTAAWAMPASHTPPMLAVAIGPSRFTHDLIINSNEFVVNVPGADLLDAVWYCGTKHGHELDKFAECNLSAQNGKEVAAPLIGEAIGAIECRLSSHPTAGDHTIMVGEVVAAWAKAELFETRLLVEKSAAQTLHHLGGPHFCRPGAVLAKK